MAAVNHNAPYLIVEAPAGSGKTHTAIQAILKYRKDHPTDKICFITYTRAATAEMQNRLINQGVSDVDVCTIHS